MRLFKLAIVVILTPLLHAQAPPFTVVLDPAHGGADPGAQLSPDHPEKDFTLALARKLAAQLRQQGITVISLRDSDTSLSADQRAEETDAKRPDLYLALHAVPGTAPLRIYTAQLPASRGNNSDSARSGFLPWKSAQSAWLPESKTFASAVIVAAAAQSEGVELHSARIPTLPSITAPAVAIEVSDREDQNKIVKILAAAIQQERGAP